MLMGSVKEDLWLVKKSLMKDPMVNLFMFICYFGFLDERYYRASLEVLLK